MGIKEAVGVTVAEAERNVSDWCDQFAMSLHKPLELDDGVWCTNHWRGRRPWPCKDYEDAARRKIERDQTSV